MDKLVERAKGLLKTGKNTTTALTDTGALMTVGFIVLYVICYWYARNGPPVNTRFQDCFSTSALTWVAICIAIGIYTSKKTQKGNEN